MRSLLIIFCICSIALHAQNNDAPAPLSTWNGKTFSIDTNKYRFAINFNDTTLFANTWRYMALGWQWNYAMPRIINKRLSVNVQPGSVDGNREGSFNAAPTNRTLYWNFQPTTIYHRFYAQALEWHPAVEPRPVFNFIPTPGDTGGAVFGFRSRPYGRVVTTKGSPHFMNIVLEDSTPNQPKRILAFSKPYYSARDRVGLIRDQSIGTDGAGWTNRDSTLNLENRTGKKWYFTVHLKRSDATFSINDTTPVIGFSLKYYKVPKFIDKNIDSAYIKFDSVSALPSEMRLVKGRGYMDRKLQAVPAGGDSTVFVIRRNMLRPFNNNPDSAYVTLSAYFNTYEHKAGTTDTTNPSFPLLNGYDFKLDQSVIDSLDIQAWYYGKCNVAVDWVRLETPFARTLFRGERDSLLAMQLSRDLDIMRQDMQRHSTKRVRIASFYGIDEVEALPYYIRFHRYLSSLYDRRLITEAGSSQAYMHMVPQRAYWTGGNFNANHLDFLFTPFKPESQTGVAGTDNPRNIERLWANRAGGWAGTYGRQEAYNFECVGCNEYGYGFPNQVAKNPPVQPSQETHSKNGYRSLCYSEQTYFYVGERSTNMLYGKAPWYDYVNAHMRFRSGVWRATSRTDPSVYDTLPYVSGSNPYWPEQLRSQLWWNLILGCKGFLCDGFSAGSDSTFQEWKQKIISGSLTFDRNTGKASRNWINVGSMLAMPADFRSKINGQFDTIGTQTLLDPDIGPDYYTEKTDSIRSVRAFPDTSRQVLFSSFLAARYYGQTRYVDTIYKLSYMKTEIEPDTKPFLFMGMRSVRNEVLKFFDYVSTHEAELLNLELLSYTGKGFHFTRSARADSTEYYSKFIDMRWGAVRTQGINEAVAEPWDTVNTFVDMSVLRRTDVAMDSMFYVGVVNRRTNPLVIARLANGSVDTAGKRYWEQHRYIPGIEFDSILATPNSPYKKYEQYGARIISVPFTYRRPNGSAVLLRIQTLDNTLDTVIGSSSRLTLPYKPGEGRLFRVTVLPAISDGANGSLQNSNQRKLVAYPYMRRVGNRLETTDSMVYHLCYHRTDSLGRSHVYYRRSVPQRPARVGADGLAAGLRWEQECDVSGALQIQLLNGDTASRNCAFPTLVVRMDETTTPPMPRVYVVFACEESESSNRYSIVENVFGAQESARNSRPRELARSTGRRMKVGRSLDREEFLGTWGAPAVNASAGGNYYAFADSLRGICIRFKSPAQTLFSPYDTNSVRFATNRLSECVHPNLNTYSRISAGESSCALVWAEDTMLSSEQTHHIYYTHLQSSIGGSSHYLPRFVSDRTSCRVNNDSSIAQISDVAAGFDHQFPVVYRGVEKYNFNLKVPRIQWWLPRDRISWQSSSQPSRLNQTQSWWITSRGVDVSFPGGYFLRCFSGSTLVFISTRSNIIWSVPCSGTLV